MILHRDSCAALCSCPAHVGVQIVNNACDCNPPSGEELDELRMAAELAVHIYPSLSRLDAALGPFRKTAGEGGE
jgi:hypothetical protein